MLGQELRERVASIEFLKDAFLGILAAEELADKLLDTERGFCIVNTATTADLGRHWYVVFKHSHQEYEVMDSLGTSLQEVRSRLGVEVVASSTIEISFNSETVQAPHSKQCGEFCFYFLFERMANSDMPFEEIFHDCFFVEDLETNEYIVAHFWKTGMLLNI
jgi:hypothetical protein